MAIDDDEWDFDDDPNDGDYDDELDEEPAANGRPELVDPDEDWGEI